MPPSLLSWVIEKELYVEFRLRVRPVLARGRLDELTPEAVGDLCLRRALTFQREARHASLLRQREALASACRSAVEAAIVGLYSLHTNDEQWRWRLGRAGLMYLDKSAAAFFGEPTMSLTPFMVDAFGESLADAPGMHDLLTLAKRTDRLVTFDGSPVCESLYGEFFQPLSNTSVHTGLVALGRYYSIGSRRLRRRPWGVIPRRGLIRTTDAATAFLAAGLAAKRLRDASWFVAYGQDQLARANRPVAILIARTAVSPRMLVRLPAIARLSRNVAALLNDPDFMDADDEEQLRRVHHLINKSRLPDELAAMVVAAYFEYGPQR